MAVSLINRNNHTNAVKHAIELCNGFDALKSDHSVLIKPNLVMGANKKMIPPFGKVTTARVVEQLIRALLDHTCKQITSGEGAAVMPEVGSDTMSAMKFSGVDKLGEKYGVKLKDFGYDRTAKCAYQK